VGSFPHSQLASFTIKMANSREESEKVSISKSFYNQFKGVFYGAPEGPSIKNTNFFGRKNTNFFVKNKQTFLWKKHTNFFLKKKHKLFFGEKNTNIFGKKNKLFLEKKTQTFFGKKNTNFFGKKTQTFLEKKTQTFFGTNTWPHTCTINCTRWQTRILL
jgi:hypothetical protein